MPESKHLMKLTIFNALTLSTASFFHSLSVFPSFPFLVFHSNIITKFRNSNLKTLYIYICCLSGTFRSASVSRTVYLLFIACYRSLMNIECMCTVILTNQDLSICLPLGSLSHPGFSLQDTFLSVSIALSYPSIGL